MKQILILLILLLSVHVACFAQKIARSSLSSFGNSKNENGTVFRQTIGQASNTSVFSSDNAVLIQGFQQPVSGKYNTAIKKQCTLHLNPNPANEIVDITVSENISNNQIAVYNMRGELVFKTTTYTPHYQMDISKFSPGVYMVDFLSQSGYVCRQKLVVIR